MIQMIERQAKPNDLFIALVKILNTKARILARFLEIQAERTLTDAEAELATIVGAEYSLVLNVAQSVFLTEEVLTIAGLNLDPTLRFRITELAEKSNQAYNDLIGACPEIAALETETENANAAMHSYIKQNRPDLAGGQAA